MAFALMGDAGRAWELFSMLNPVHHSLTPAARDTYRIEPYAVAADVYAVVPHVGRGGWTWYTGSAGWMYRLLVETLLGVGLEGEKLRISPRLPPAWTGFRIHYRYRETLYHITVRRLAANSAETPFLVLDGMAIAGEAIPLADDRCDHAAEINLPAEAVAEANGNGMAESRGQSGHRELENA
jgi:cellobiose phosphorylase